MWNSLTQGGINMYSLWEFLSPASSDKTTIYICALFMAIFTYYSLHTYKYKVSTPGP